MEQWALRQKTKFMQIRLTPENREQMERVATANYLELSVWARQTLLKAVDEWEREQELEEESEEER